MDVTNLLPGWPGGDSGKLRDAAKEWYALSTQLTNIAKEADASVQHALVGWQGDSAKKFTTTWNSFITANTQAASDAHNMGKGLDTAADKIDEIHEKYGEIAAGLVAAFAASVAIGFFTFGIGAAAEDAAATATAIAAVDALLTSLNIEISTAVLADVGGTIADVLAQRWAQGVIVGFASDLTFQEVPSLLTNGTWQPVDLKELGISTATGGLGGKLIEGALWRRALIGLLINGGGTFANEIAHGNQFNPANLLLSGGLGSIGGMLEGADPSEASQAQAAITKLEDDVKLATLFKQYYEDDPAAAARVAAKIDNPAVKDAYALLTRYPNLFNSQITDAENAIAASHTVIGKVLMATTREKISITYEALEKAVDKAHEKFPDLAKEGADEQAQAIIGELKAA